MDHPFNVEDYCALPLTTIKVPREPDALEKSLSRASEECKSLLFEIRENIDSVDDDKLLKNYLDIIDSNLMVVNLN